jgi:hypothetical protein
LRKIFGREGEVNPDETVVDIAKKETTRQTVILIFSLVGTVGAVYVLKLATDPSERQAWKMRAALAVKRYAQKRADWWQNVADKAATAYHMERNG